MPDPIWGDSKGWLERLKAERADMTPEQLRGLYQQEPVIVGWDLASGPDTTVRRNSQHGYYERRTGPHGRWERCP